MHNSQKSWCMKTLQQLRPLSRIHVGTCVNYFKSGFSFYETHIFYCIMYWQINYLGTTSCFSEVWGDTGDSRSIFVICFDKTSQPDTNCGWTRPQWRLPAASPGIHHQPDSSPAACLPTQSVKPLRSSAQPASKPALLIYIENCLKKEGVCVLLHVQGSASLRGRCSLSLIKVSWFSVFISWGGINGSQDVYNYTCKTCKVLFYAFLSRPL